MVNKERFLIKKTECLSGDVTVSGSKNASLPILAATLLAEGKTTLKNVPDLTDISNMCEILTCLGAKITKKELSKTFSRALFSEKELKLRKKNKKYCKIVQMC